MCILFLNGKIFSRPKNNKSFQKEKKNDRFDCLDILNFYISKTQYENPKKKLGEIFAKNATKS